MNDRDAFIRAIVANPDDDTVRLAFADWLDEHDEPTLAEFIRVQCELEPVRDRYDIPRAAELHAREDELGQFARETNGAVEERFGEYVVSAVLRRGFPYQVNTTAEAFVECGSGLLEIAPTFRKLRLHRVNGWADRLAACPHLADFPEIELACWYAPEEAHILAGAEAVRRAEVLTVWLGGTDTQWVIGEEKLVRLFAAADPRLRELRLFDPESGGAGLVQVANEVAGRPVATHIDPDDGRLPFCPEFAYFCPGTLPDGRRVVSKPIGNGIHVIVFGADDRVAEEYAVPRTEELRTRFAKEHYLYGASDEFRAAIHRAVGSTPAFIRVFPFRWPDNQDCPLPGRSYFHDDWNAVGVPDDPAGADYDDRAFGNGGRVLWVLSQYGCGVGWCDERGQVHST